MRHRPGMLVSNLSSRVARVARVGRRARRAAPHVTRKLASLTPREWLHMAEGQIALLWAQLLVWVRPQGQLVASTPDGGPGLVMPEPTPLVEDVATLDPEARRARELALGITRAAYFGLFRPLCLVRSVALQRVLERHGVRGSLVRVGVRWDEGRFAAHAWVELRGQVLGDQLDHVARFTELSNVNLLR